MPSQKLSRAAVAACVFLLAAMTLSVSPAQAETKAERDQRMAWWREARFGMFIHWGVYSVPAGEWKGKAGPGHWPNGS